MTRNQNAALRKLVLNRGNATNLRQSTGDALHRLGYADKLGTGFYILTTEGLAHWRSLDNA